MMVEKRRLQWRCRRGMLELDLLLKAFIERYFQQLDDGQIIALDKLLNLPDNDLWDLLMNRFSGENGNEQQLLFWLSSYSEVSAY
jgi:antitoxin CptB